MDNKTIKEELAKKTSEIFSKMVEDEKEIHKSKGYSYFEKNIIKNIGISKTAFTTFKNGNDGRGKDAKPKLPDLISLYKVHNYFNVSYSYLLGESETKDINNLGEGINLGLNELSIDMLKKLNKNKKDPNLKLKLFVINNLITNEKFISGISNIIMHILSIRVSNKKYEPIDFHYNENSELIEFRKFKLSSLMNEVIQRISNQNDIPDVIIKQLQKKPIHIDRKKKIVLDNMLEKSKNNT